MAKKKNNVLTVHYSFPENFFDTTLRDVMKDEFQVACRKWKVRLDEGQEQNVYDNSARQVEAKFSHVSGNRWVYGTLTATISIEVEKNLENSLEVSLPADSDMSSFGFVVRKINNWVAHRDYADDREQIAFNDFYDYVLECFTNWVRTAVFYGVASYK